MIRTGTLEAGRDNKPPQPPVGGIELSLRGMALRALETSYRVGTITGTFVLLAIGGVFPVLRRWLRDEITDWRGVIETLGGLWVTSKTIDPDADIGPAIVRTDAPELFRDIGELANSLGARSPDQVRLTYLPCCGVLAWRRSRALVLGLPLLYVLNRVELRAVLAHELSHLARGDATRSAQSARFVQSLGQRLNESCGASYSPLRYWARLCWSLSKALLDPIARGQEGRADRAAAATAGGDATASALVKVALIQPLFREVLEYYDPSNPDGLNIYAYFRAFWGRLPIELHTAIRHRVLTESVQSNDSAHPLLLDRLAIVQSYPALTPREIDLATAATAVGDLEALELMLHNRLFSLADIEPSVFHRAGS